MCFNKIGGGGGLIGGLFYYFDGCIMGINIINLNKIHQLQLKFVEIYLSELKIITIA